MKSNALIICASFVIVIAGMKVASTIIVPFLLAIFIAVISSPSLLWLERKGLPKIIAFFLVLFLVVFILGTVAYITSNAINSFAAKLPELQVKLNIFLDLLVYKIQSNGINIEKSDILVLEDFDPTKVLLTMGNLLKSISKIFSNSFLIFLLVTFMLFETRSFDDKAYYLSRLNAKNQVLIKTFLNNLKRYLAIKTIASMVTGLIIGCILSMLGVNYAVLWGLLAFLLNYIPTIGSIIAAIPAILITMLEGSMTDALWVTTVFLVVNLAIGNFIEPKFLGKGLGISPLIVLLSLLFWGWTLGPAGMFLAIPLTMSVKIGLDVNPRTKWISVILSDKVPKEDTP